MNENSDEQIKYWKYSSVISGVIGISFLIEIIFLLHLIVPEAFFPTTTVSPSIAEWIVEILYFFKSSPQLIFFTLLAMPYIIFSTFFILAGTLASRGKYVGTLMALILSIVIVIFVSFYLSSTYSSGVTSFFLISLGVLGSPQFLLSLFNIYYSLKAIKSRINKRVMSLLAFFSCSIQYAVAIILVIFGMAMIILTIPIFIGMLEYGIAKNPQLIILLFIMAITDISLPTSFILLHISVNHVFNHEEEISKKKVSICIGLTIVLLLIITYTFPIFGFAVGASTIPFLATSLGFAMLIRPPESIEQVESRTIVPPMSFPATGEEAREYRTFNFKYCRFCGNKIPNDSIYCEYCGKKLDG
ncbi:MAG: zinc ribbon domain-containing protein [Thermoproteota archaeon]